MKTLNTIFIIEDSTLDRTMLKDHLSKKSKIKITEYSSGDACVKELVMGTIDPPDLILMDYFLDSSFGPAKDGLETLARINEICPETSVIMYTSVDNERIIELAKKKGALDYVVKNATGFSKLDSVLEKHFSVTK